MKILWPLISLLFIFHANGKEVNYQLEIREQQMNFTGENTLAMTINGGVPGPVLTFNEGDIAKITVTNYMTVETSIHWHGLILPNFQDGVPYLTTPPIRPGETFTYEFPLKHSGTYWYHSHTGLQEQRGVFGSIVIHPREQKLSYDRDVVLVLSDWTNENPSEGVFSVDSGSLGINLN